MEPRASRYAISAVFAAFGGLVGGWAPHLPDVKRNLGLSNHVLGLALLASAVGAVATMPLAGVLIHRFGSRIVGVIAGLCACVMVPWLIVARSLPSFMATLLVLGACYGQLDVGMNTHSVAVQDRFKRPILSAVHGWFSMGGFLGGAGAAVAYTHGLTTLQHLIIASGVWALVLVIACPFLLPTDVDKGAEGPKFAVPRGVLLLLGALCFCGFITETGVWEWGAVLFRNSLHASSSVAAIGVGLTSFAMAAGRFLGDGAVHRWGHGAILTGSGVLTAVGVVLAVSIPLPFVAIGGFCIAGVGIANIVPILFKAAGSVPGIPASAGLSAVTTCGYAGFLFGPPAIGFIADWRSLDFSLGLLSLLGIAVAVFGSRAAAAGTLTRPESEAGTVP